MQFYYLSFMNQLFWKKTLSIVLIIQLFSQTFITFPFHSLIVNAQELTATPTLTISPTPTLVPTALPTASPSATPTLTSTPNVLPTATSTPIPPTPTVTLSPTYTPMPTSSVLPKIMIVQADQVNNIACGIGSALPNDGLRFQATNLPTGAKVQARYKIGGGAYNDWADMSSFAGFLTITPITGGNEFFLTNTGLSPAGAAGWNIRIVDDTNNPIMLDPTSGSLLPVQIQSDTYVGVEYTITTDPQSAACTPSTMSTVTVCKNDTFGNPLSNCQIAFTSTNPIETISTPSRNTAWNANVVMSSSNLPTNNYVLNEDHPNEKIDSNLV